MLKAVCVGSIFIGAVIMTLSILKYSKALVRSRKMQGKNNYFRLPTYWLSLILMCFFLMGYIFTGLFIALSSQTGMKDVIIAMVYLFGAVFVDIMIEAQRQMMSMHAKETLATVTNNIDNMIHVVDPETYEVLFINRSNAMHVGKDPSELIGKTCWKVMKHNMKEPCEKCPAQKLIELGKPLEEPYYWENHDAENGRVFSVTSTSVRWIDGRHALLCNMIDISERKQYERTLQQCAMADKLTGAYNRTWGHQILDGMFQPGYDLMTSLTFCFFDLDRLKTINDLYGHDAGDRILCEFVKCVKENVRKQDFLIRWGGDEFVLVMQCDGEKAYKVMEKIYEKIKLRNANKPEEEQIFYSYGLEEVDGTHGNKWEIYISNADAKMYRQKFEKGVCRS